MWKAILFQPLSAEAAVTRDTSYNEAGIVRVYLARMKENIPLRNIPAPLIGINTISFLGSPIRV